MSPQDHLLFDDLVLSRSLSLSRPPLPVCVFQHPKSHP